MRICDGCLINGGGMAIANLFNNKIDDIILLWAMKLAHLMVERSCTWQYKILSFV
jgi:hypothetical protein